MIDAETLANTFLEEIKGDVWTACNTENYQRFEYDLSGYTDDTVILAIGVRKAALTVESIFFTEGTVDSDPFVFGRTTEEALSGLEKVTIASGTEYKATGDSLIQDTFVTDRRGESG